MSYFKVNYLESFVTVGAIESFHFVQSRISQLETTRGTVHPRPHKTWKREAHR